VYFPDLQRHSFLRPLAWRYERAQSLVSDGRYCLRHRDDQLTQRAVHFLRALRRCPPERQSDKLARDYPNIYAAYRLSEEGGPKRLEMEARLLARQSPVEIADLVGLPVAVVDMYEALFFQVMDRLAGRDWITVRAIGRWNGDVIPAVLLRGLAYHHGPVMVDALAPYLAGNIDPFESHPDPATLEGRVVQSLRLVLLAEMLPQGAENATKLFRLHLDLIEHERKTSPKGIPREILTARVLAALENSAGQTARQTLQDGRLSRPSAPAQSCRQFA